MALSKFEDSDDVEDDAEGDNVVCDEGCAKLIPFGTLFQRFRAVLLLGSEKFE